MRRIVVQRTAGRAAHLALLLLLQAAAVAGVLGCRPPVRLVPDLRTRPCGSTIDPAGTALDRSLVSWMSPDDPDDRGKLDAWCETVGPVVVHEPQPAGSSAADRLVIVGWNVHLGAGDIVRLVDDLRSGRLGRDLTDGPLVLLLQETVRSGAQVPVSVAGAPAPRRLAPHGSLPRRGAIELAAALGLNVFYLPAMRNGRGDGPDTREDRGLAILSSLPLTGLQAIELPFERQRRPAAAATIWLEPPSDAPLSLRLVNVHLESRSGARRLWLGSPHARNRQVRALMTSLTGNVPAMLEGDLNTWANREPLLERLGREFTPCTDGRPTFSGGLRLDWIFARLPAGWTITCRRLDEKYGSDHYPIVAMIEKGVNAQPPTPNLPKRRRWELEVGRWKLAASCVATAAAARRGRCP